VTPKWEAPSFALLGEKGEDMVLTARRHAVWLRSE